MTPQAKQLIEQFRADRERAQKALDALERIVLGDGWIVRCASIYLRFDIQDMTATNPRHCGSPVNATRFTERDAKHVATGVHNAGGDQGQALHVNEALRDYIAERSSLIQFIEDAQAKTDNQP